MHDKCATVCTDRVSFCPPSGHQTSSCRARPWSDCSVPPFDPQILNAKGGLFLTRPSLAHYTATREELLWRANDVLGWAASGELKIRIGARFPLADAAEAHRQLSARMTTGKILLTP